MRASRRLVLEAAACGLVASLATMLVSPADPLAGGLAPHPAWAAVMVLAARYGMRGLFASLATSAAGVAATALAAGGPMAALEVRFTRLPELLTLSAAVAVAWVGSEREARAREAQERAERERARAGDAEAAVEELCGAVVAWQDRAGRLGSSLALLRDVATRLAEGDAAAVAQAALELAQARTGARAAVLYGRAGARAGLRARAWRGAWSADRSEPPAGYRDQTALAALGAGRATPVTAVDGAGVLDSDAAAPVVDEQGRVRGVLALRGLPRAAVAGAALVDLAQAAGWCGAALARAERRGRRAELKEG